MEEPGASKNSFLYCFSLEHLTVCELGTVAFCIHLHCLGIFFVKYAIFSLYCAILSFVVGSCKVCIMLFLKAYKVVVCWLGLCFCGFGAHCVLCTSCVQCATVMIVCTVQCIVYSCV